MSLYTLKPHVTSLTVNQKVLEHARQLVAADAAQGGGGGRHAAPQQPAAFTGRGHTLGGGGGDAAAAAPAAGAGPKRQRRGDGAPAAAAAAVEVVSLLSDSDDEPVAAVHTTPPPRAKPQSAPEQVTPPPTRAPPRGTFAKNAARAMQPWERPALDATSRDPDANAPVSLHAIALLAGWAGVAPLVVARWMLHGSKQAERAGTVADCIAELSLRQVHAKLAAAQGVTGATPVSVSPSAASPRRVPMPAALPAPKTEADVAASNAALAQLHAERMARKRAAE